MPDKKSYLVSVVYDTYGNVVSIAKVSNVNPQAYTKLKNESVAYEQKHNEEKAELLHRVDNLEKLVGELQQEIKLLKGEE